MRALVVDDSRGIRHLLRVILGELGFDVHCVESAEEGVACVEAEAPDVVLLDGAMERRTSLVHAVRRRVQTPIVVVASEAESYAAFEALSEGADDLLLKPFSADAVREKLASLGVDARAA